MSDTQYQQSYSEAGFWDKAKTYAVKAGDQVLAPALTLYYAARDPQTPTWAKSTMYGALGYFILPVDAIPDLAPAIGYTDDLGVLVAACVTVAAHITKEHQALAQAKLAQWFN
ncbi:Uncharacterized membrane protein YkvA, DUF1232 family [Allopseudospirillum japonicum]|uniref:Uncharacterized membrane protein YkvA, DUF1232 family n=1 Tax=Allopseudospirillum japonicum TaxID=64971 RepID=A0A1H6R4F0_9GAMM|nr:YkvA family protein [Allopseudospirillum japonicum]SEI48104.1 Uncharacterized membrane protein YkvA, DUF1232 family [Allopseudospirillum japonicum]